MIDRDKAHERGRALQNIVRLQYVFAFVLFCLKLAFFITLLWLIFTFIDPHAGCPPWPSVQMVCR